MLSWRRCAKRNVSWRTGSRSGRATTVDSIICNRIWTAIQESHCRSRAGILLNCDKRTRRPADKIKAAEDELDKLERAQLDIAAGVEKVTETLHELEGEEQNKRQKQEEINERSRASARNCERTQGRLMELLQPAFQDAERLMDSERDRIQDRSFAGRLRRLRRPTTDRDRRIISTGSASEKLSSQSRRSNTVSTFPGSARNDLCPPSNTEGLAQTELWVRVYPDEVAVHTHERILTDSEVVAGELYWTELVDCRASPRRTRQSSPRGWRHLVELFGGQRAAWIARQTKPTDFDSLAAGAAATDVARTCCVRLMPNFFEDLLALDLSATSTSCMQDHRRQTTATPSLVLPMRTTGSTAINAVVRTIITGFPVHDLTKTDGWTRAPRTQVMPDRFVLLLFGTEDGELRARLPATSFPTRCMLVLSRSIPKAGFAEKDDVLVYGGAFDWMSDFDKAVAQGMGFRVRLTDAEARNGFAKVFVLGVFLSASATGQRGHARGVDRQSSVRPEGFQHRSAGHADQQHRTQRHWLFRQRPLR